MPQEDSMIVFGPIRLLTKSTKLASYLKKLLKSNGYGITSYRSHSELLKGLRLNPANIVFLDCEIVEQVGNVIYTHIVTSCPRCGIILLYPKERHDLVKEAMSMGAYGCIGAPYDALEVLTMVGLWLRGRGRKVVVPVVVPNVKQHYITP